MENKHSALVRELVKEIRSIKRVYKYLTYDSAVKMLTYCNLQFTRADKLNDCFDITPSKFNYQYLEDAAVEHHSNPEDWVEKAMQRHSIMRLYGICSLGISPNNQDLWERYATSNDIMDGVCIEIDLRATINSLIKTGVQPIAFKVRYYDDTNSLIPYSLYLGTEEERHIAAYLLLATKNKAQWNVENEVRLLLLETFDGDYRRADIFKSCIKGVYLGSQISDVQKEHISQIVKSNKWELHV